MSVGFWVVGRYFNGPQQTNDGTKFNDVTQPSTQTPLAQGSLALSSAYCRLRWSTRDPREETIKPPQEKPANIPTASVGPKQVLVVISNRGIYSVPLTARYGRLRKRLKFFDRRILYERHPFVVSALFIHRKV